MKLTHQCTTRIAHLIVTFITSTLGLLVISLQVNAADLRVNIASIEQGKGHVLVALYADESAYASGKANFSSSIKADQQQQVVTFKNLPEGEYAIKMYQDENDNNKLDFNMFGIPKEGYGFSNNVGMFGAPAYSEAKFIIKDNTEISIELF